MKMPELNLPTGIESRCSPDAETTAIELAQEVTRALQAAIEQRGAASLAVSGGSTPVAFFESLSQSQLDWSRVSVLLADERWVEESSQDSNTRLVREHLLQGPAAAARYVNLKQSDGEAEAVQPRVEQALAEVPWPLDVLILGMGNDGHTASLFPDAPQLREALTVESQRTMVMTPPSQSQTRISLTLTAMADARFTALHLRGDVKLATLKKAAESPHDIEAMPIRAFLKPGLTLFWSP